MSINVSSNGKLYFDFFSPQTKCYLINHEIDIIFKCGALIVDTQTQQPSQRPSTRSTVVQPSANSTLTSENNNQPSPSRGPRANAATRSSPRKTSAVR